MAVSRINEAGLNINQYGNRNLIINGEMQVAQRGSVPAIQSAYGACDRFKLTSNSAARFDTSQSTDVPSGQGFASSLKLDCSTADTSVAAGDLYTIQQLIEGQNLQHLLYGTSSAKQITLSFWVKSPKTGIHNLEVESVDGGTFNIHQYTIASANTWQNVKMTIDGYQTTAIANDNTAGLNINWWLLAGTTFSGGSYSENTWHSTNNKRAVGQVNVADSTSNDFYLTGVQLEVGDTATDFEHRTFADELQRCQRYYEKSFNQGTAPAIGVSGNGANNDIGSISYTSNNVRTPSVKYSVAKRAAPTVTQYHPGGYGTPGSNNKPAIYIGGSWSSPSAVAVQSLESYFFLDLTATGASTGSGYLVGLGWSSDAEL